MVKKEVFIMEKWEEIIKFYNKPVSKKLKKMGTIAVNVVEATPVVWKDKLLRFEWKRNAGLNEDIGGGKKGFYHFVDMETNERSTPFAHGYVFGSAIVENEQMFVYATESWGGQAIDLFVSSDLNSYEKHRAITFPENYTVYNTSVCKGECGYVMAIEIGKPVEIAGKPFTIIFARSNDLYDWEILDPTEFVHTKERYSACPVIRFSKGYYYMTYLEEMPMYKFVPYIARSTDLKEWEIAPVNPVMFYSDEDRILAGEFTEEEKFLINTSLNTNNSDLDICEFQNKTYIIYSWGNQMGREFLAYAIYDGPMDEFFESFF
jgi:hypothetical protein